MSSRNGDRSHVPRVLDPTLYKLTDEEEQFFKATTGIQDSDALREHILAVQKKAYEFYPYHCIKVFSFTKLKISRMPMYKHALEVGRTRPDAILLDIGCCFGNDARKAVVDGYPVQNVVASDLRPEFWDMGHELFRSTPESFPAKFIPGDAFKAEFIDLSAELQVQQPALQSLTSLTPLKGHVSIIHASAFFHLFDESGQRALAERLGALLSPAPGSMIFGAHAGLPETGMRPSNMFGEMFCHSPETWKELWIGDKGVFSGKDVVVEAKLVQSERVIEGLGQASYLLVYSVLRV